MINKKGSIRGTICMFFCAFCMYFMMILYCHWMHCCIMKMTNLNYLLASDSSIYQSVRSIYICFDFDQYINQIYQIHRRHTKSMWWCLLKLFAFWWILRFCYWAFMKTIYRPLRYRKIKNKQSDALLCLFWTFIIDNERSLSTGILYTGLRILTRFAVLTYVHSSFLISAFADDLYGSAME